MAATTRQKSGWITANIVTILVMLIPVVWIFSLSFKDPSTITDPTFFPTKWTWANYSGIFNTSDFTRPLLNSIGIGLIATFISVVLASLAAYAVARLAFPGKSALIGMSLMIAMFPLISLATPLFNIERALGLFNTWIGLIIPYIAFGLPLGIYTLSAFFREIPWELEKAAKMDGATPVPGVRQGHRAARGARHGDHGHLGVPVLLERVPAGLHAHGDDRRPDRAGRARLLHRQLAVRGAHRVDLGRRGGHHDPDHHLRASLPAADRRRADIRRGQGLAGRPKEQTVAEIILDHLTKRFPDGALAVNDVSLNIRDGEFVILVGPSGCGKSTTLNMIAGLEDITEGELRIGGKVVNDKAPKDRDIAMVFQSYALYPHMTVRENMGFALKLAKTPKNVIDEKVGEAARILDLTQHLDRKPANLSGGQRQRVAMGRAIVRDPAAFLMDEPLSNLDAKLRVQMRTEVSRIQRRLGTTMVYVTHDQTEAMTLGDRVAVMRLGVLQQVASPQELYDHPANLFVAGFIGSPAMNFVPGTLEEGRLRTGLGDMPLSAAQRQAIEAAGAAGTSSWASGPSTSRTPRWCRRTSCRRGLQFNATIDVIESLGSDKFVYFTQELGQAANVAELEELARDSGRADTGGTTETVVARLDPASRITEGENARLWVDGRKLHVFDPASGRNLTLGAAAAATDTAGGAAGGGQPRARPRPSAKAGRTPGWPTRNDAAVSLTSSPRSRSAVSIR